MGGSAGPIDIDIHTCTYLYRNRRKHVLRALGCSVKGLRDIKEPMNLFAGHILFISI